MAIHTPTVRLLKASVLVALSGIFRLYIAFLFIRAKPNLLAYIAGGLVIYTVYTLDRALECKEDAVNRCELTGSKKEVGILVSVSTFCIGASILFIENLFVVPFLPLIIGCLYSKGVKIMGFNMKLKGGFGVKNLVVALTWGVFIAGITTSTDAGIASLFFVFLFFSIKVFINSVIYDFKDVKGDSLAGIRTLPVQIGEKNTIGFLSVLHLILHTGMFLAVLIGIIAFEPLILLYSFISGITCIFHFTLEKDTKQKERKLIREFLIDGESATVILLRAFTGSLFPLSALYNN